MYTVTFIPEFQVMLSRRSTFTCKYCNFNKTPSPELPSLKQFRSYLRTAQRLGATQITLTAGEGIASIFPVENTCRYYGFKDFYSYITELCRIVTTARGQNPLLPILNVGAIPYRNLVQIRPYVAGVRLLLDSMDPLILSTVEKESPQKNPTLRLFAIENIAKLNIPVFTGTRIGLGETEESWINAVEAINTIHNNTGLVHSFSLIPFHPLPFSEMEHHPPVDQQLFFRAVASVRKHLHKDIRLVAELNGRLDMAPESIIKGAFDIGAMRLGSNQKIYLDTPNALLNLQQLLTKMNISLEARQPICNDFQKQFHVPDLVYGNIQRYKKADLKYNLLPTNDLTPPYGSVVHY